MSRKLTESNKTGLKLTKVTYGEMDKEECFRLALEPHFRPEKYGNPYLKSLRTH